MIMTSWFPVTKTFPFEWISYIFHSEMPYSGQMIRNRNYNCLITHAYDSEIITGKHIGKHRECDET